MIRFNCEALGQRVLPLAGGHVDHGGRSDYGGDGVGAELQDPEIALDILRAEAIVGVRGIPLVEVAEAVDLGGDVVADEQGVARPRSVQRVLFLHEGQLFISWMEEQALRGAEGHDLARAVPYELVAAPVVGEAKIVDVAFLYLRECLEGKLRAQFVEVAEFVVVPPDPAPAFALLPLLRSHLRGRVLGYNTLLRPGYSQQAHRSCGRQPEGGGFRQESPPRQVTVLEIVDQLLDAIIVIRWAHRWLLSLALPTVHEPPYSQRENKCPRSSVGASSPSQR